MTAVADDGGGCSRNHWVVREGCSMRWEEIVAGTRGSEGGVAGVGRRL